MKIRSLQWLMFAMIFFALSGCSYWNHWTHPPQPTKPMAIPSPTPNEVKPNQNKANLVPVVVITPNKPSPTYLAADRSPPRYKAATKKCIHFNGLDYCGYDCKLTPTHAQCAAKPEQRCIVGNDGTIACGYDCIKSAHAIGCGKHLYDNCAENSQGEILCGNNCSVREDDSLVCGK